MDSDVELDYNTDEEKNRPTPKPIKGKKVEKKLSKALLNDPLFKDWVVIESDGSAKCICCSTVLKGGKTEFLRHKKTQIHQKNALAKSLQPSVAAFIPQHDKVKQLEAAMCSFIVENDLPISFVEPLTEFCKALPDKPVLEKLQMGKQKATNVIRQGLRPYFHDEVVSALKTHYFSVFIDETTDISTKSQMAILISYFSSEDFSTKVDVVDVVEVKSATAEGLYETMIETLRTNQIPLQNWVGFCADTTAVMMGAHNSVAQLIKKEYPSVFIMKCSCHSIHLTASYACKKLPNSLEDLVRTVYNHFKRSPKRTASFCEFQKFFDPNSAPKKMLAPGQTRWLSLQNCVRRVLECWGPLTNYWRVLAFEDKTHANDHVLSTLSNPLLKCMMEFADYGLGLLNDFNTFFQAETPLFGMLKSKVGELLKVLALNFMKPQYVRATDAFQLDPSSTENYIEVNDVYLGVVATETLFELADADPQEVKKLRSSVRDFYIEAMLQIKRRFDFSTDAELFKDAQFLQPENARNLNPTTIHPLVKRYAGSGSSQDAAKIDAQWREQSIVAIESGDMHSYWKEVFFARNSVGKLRFEELSKFVSIFLSLPFSNAMTERLFSCLQNVKSAKRNKLDNETLSALLCVKYGLKRTGKNSLFFMENKVLTPKYSVVSNATASSSKKMRLDSLNQPSTSTM